MKGSPNKLSAVRSEEPQDKCVDFAKQVLTGKCGLYHLLDQGNTILSRLAWLYTPRASTEHLLFLDSDRSVAMCVCVIGYC